MMSNLVSRVEQRASNQAARIAHEISEELRSLIAAASVRVQGSKIIVSGRQLAARWIADPALRFLRRGA